MIEVVVRAFAIWLLILALAVANGALRETMLIPRLGKPSALTLSGILLSALIVLTAYLFLPWLSVHASSQLLVIGCGWLLLTLAFEFCFSLARGKSLAVVLDAYAFKDGNIWPVVLLVIACAPLVAAKLRGSA